MAKILRKILLFIPILVLFPFTITPVFAYGDMRSSNRFYSIDVWTSQPNSSRKIVAQVERNSEIIYFTVPSSETSYHYNHILFKNKTSDDLFLFIFFDTSSVGNINFDTSTKYFDNYNCMRYESPCSTTTKGYTFYNISDNNYNYNSCKSYYNNLGFELSSTYSCNFVTQFSSTNNFINWVSTEISYSSNGLKNLIDMLSTDYDVISMNENTTFSVDNVQIFPTPEEPEEPIPPEPEPPVIDENLDKIFVPNYKKGQCIEILDKDTLRVFENENTNNYIDYFINSHYISKEGQTELNYTKNCSIREFTSIGYYRNDFPEILFMIGSFCLFSIGFVFILFKRFRKR